MYLPLIDIGEGIPLLLYGKIYIPMTFPVHLNKYETYPDFLQFVCLFARFVRVANPFVNLKLF